MKKVISIILSLIIISCLGMSVGAENASYPEMNVSAHGYQDGVYQDRLYYIYGEEIIIEPEVYDIGLDGIYKGVVVYLDCNKDILEYVGTPLGTIENMVRYSETETGYMAEIIWTNPYTIPLYATFTMKVAGKDNPDVTVRAFKVAQDYKLEEMNITFDLPENKVYEKDEIPHIVTNLQPPVFGDRVSFHSFGHIFAYAPQTVDEISRMLSSSDSSSVIKYLPDDAAVRENVISGDIFALEFEGKLCDFVQVFVIGDTNADGVVSSADARAVLRYSAKFNDNVGISLNSCDVNHDGSINAADARMILRVAAKLDYFKLQSITVWQNQPYKIGPLVSASDGGYMWRCTVSEEGAIEVTETIEPSVDNTGKEPDEIIDGAPALQTFMLKPRKQGDFHVHFELIRPWETEPIKEFGFTVVVDDVL